MKDEEKTKEQLISELAEMRRHKAEADESETRRKQTEDKLKHQLNFLHVLLDLIPVPVFHKDKHGIYIGCNKAYEDFLNIGRDHFIGRSVYDISPKELADIYHAKDMELFQNPGVQIYESNVLDKTSTEHSVIFQKATFTDTDGQVAGLIGVIDDITDRKRAEEALRERIKELKCLYSIADIIESNDIIEEIFRKTADIMPRGWYYPELACVRITYGGQEFRTGNFQETPWKMLADMIMRNKPIGMVEVRYLKEMPDIDEGPFLKEERDLINAIAERLGRVAERKQVEMETKLYEMRMESLLRIAQYRAKTVEDLLDFALDESISLTKSKIGYIYYYNDEKREFTLNTWSKDVMKECTIQEKKVCYELDKTGVWGEAVRQAKPIVMNDFLAPDPLKKGYPEGHAHLHRFLTIPIFSDDRIVAVLGVANKDTDYDELDIHQLTILMGSVWQIAERKHVEEEREQLILELKGALSQIKTLNGLLPICASCKKIRNDEGYWEQIEIYIRNRSEAEFSHGICPECAQKLYPELYEKIGKDKK